VPTIRFQVLYVFLVLANDRRRILHFAVTAHPIAGMDRAATAGGISLGQRAAFLAAIATASSVLISAR
jgi:hypothetical protein